MFRHMDLETQEQLMTMEHEIQRLQAAIRKHRDQKGDDRCWMDDEELYKVLPEGYTPPKRDSSVELEHCKRYIACRQNPATTYTSPERRIEELEKAIMQIGDETTAVYDEINKTLAALELAADEWGKPKQTIGKSTAKFIVMLEMEALKKKELEKLKEKLEKMEALHLYAYGEYGSELSSGDMIRQENELKEKIAAVEKEIMANAINLKLQGDKNE